jgi:hypothetical protein
MPPADVENAKVSCREALVKSITVLARGFVEVVEIFEFVDVFGVVEMRFSLSEWWSARLSPRDLILAQIA